MAMAMGMEKPTLSRLIAKNPMAKAKDKITIIVSLQLDIFRGNDYIVLMMIIFALKRNKMLLQRTSWIYKQEI